MEYFKSVPQILTTREWKVLPKTPYFNRPHIAIQSYVEGFALECAALAWARREMGLANIKVMIPFCHTIDEGRRVIEVMAANRLKQGEGGLKVYAIPAETSTASARIGSFWSVQPEIRGLKKDRSNSKPRRTRLPAPVHSDGVA